MYFEMVFFYKADGQASCIQLQVLVSQRPDFTEGRDCGQNQPHGLWTLSRVGGCSRVTVKFSAYIAHIKTLYKTYFPSITHIFVPFGNKNSLDLVKMDSPALPKEDDGLFPLEICRESPGTRRSRAWGSRKASQASLPFSSMGETAYHPVVAWTLLNWAVNMLHKRTAHKPHSGAEGPTLIVSLVALKLKLILRGTSLNLPLWCSAQTLPVRPGDGWPLGVPLRNLPGLKRAALPQDMPLPWGIAPIQFGLTEHKGWPVASRQTPLQGHPSLHSALPLSLPGADLQDTPHKASYP